MPSQQDLSEEDLLKEICYKLATGRSLSDCNIPWATDPDTQGWEYVRCPENNNGTHARCGWCPEHNLPRFHCYDRHL